ncbi:MAG: hypothetical protein Harvfovirus17_8 [Harvfovirus sp.]|uniref:Uncharacterized protein n=1 Tax=Harvfovirus sp. TaxID=2487768 RepID=A0A3G5A3R4_9VIRU|nr:MAG: hypothetical protein Harvfovirus17_8 [Harvfovirus sp.]
MDAVICKICNVRVDSHCIIPHNMRHSSCKTCSTDKFVYNGPYVFWHREYHINSLCGLYVRYNNFVVPRNVFRHKKFFAINGSKAMMCCKCFNISDKSYPNCCGNTRFSEYGSRDEEELDEWCEEELEEAYQEAAEHLCSFCFDEIPRWQTGKELDFVKCDNVHKTLTKFIKPQSCLKCLRYMSFLAQAEKIEVHGVHIYGLERSQLQCKNRIHVNIPKDDDLREQIINYLMKSTSEKTDNIYIKNIIFLLKFIPQVKWDVFRDLYLDKLKLEILVKNIQVMLDQMLNEITVVIKPLAIIVVQYIDCRYIFSQMIKSSAAMHPSTA